MNGTEFHFRADPVPSDIEGVREIVDSSGFFSREEIEVASELVRERLGRGPASGYFFLFAEAGGKVQGYTCFGPIPCTRESYDLYWIAVRNPLRGSGLGKALLRRTEAGILRMGGARVYVETSSRDLYRPTRIFYERHGYLQEASLRDFYAPGDHKVILVKSLHP
ncbi:MAG: GNAT family N-acetyltransferase [Deltaproteobacteria bacterium]|nr:GNAT family N-acetyltransferase [Deltaproteobacteria bacterium]